MGFRMNIFSIVPWKQILCTKWCEHLTRRIRNIYVSSSRVKRESECFNWPLWTLRTVILSDSKRSRSRQSFPIISAPASLCWNVHSDLWLNPHNVILFCTRSGWVRPAKPVDNWGNSTPPLRKSASMTIATSRVANKPSWLIWLDRTEQEIYPAGRMPEHDEPTTGFGYKSLIL